MEEIYNGMILFSVSKIVQVEKVCMAIWVRQFLKWLIWGLPMSSLPPSTKIICGTKISWRRVFHVIIVKTTRIVLAFPLKVQRNYVYDKIPILFIFVHATTSDKSLAICYYGWIWIYSRKSTGAVLWLFTLNVLYQRNNGNIHF